MFGHHLNTSCMCLPKAENKKVYAPMEFMQLKIVSVDILLLLVYGICIKRQLHGRKFFYRALVIYVKIFKCCCI